MATTESRFRHVCLFSAPVYGHIRSLVALAARFVHERSDVIITFAVTGDYKSKVEHELDRYFGSEEDEKALRSNIRLLHIGASNGHDHPQLFQEYFQGFPKVYPAIYAGEPLLCGTGQVYPAAPIPDVLVVDPFLLPVLLAIRGVSGNAIPILGWNSSALNSFLRTFGPESLGGLGDVLGKAEALAKETGRPVDEIAKEVNRSSTISVNLYLQSSTTYKLFDPQSGDLVQLPGMPLTYDYELNPQHEIPQLTAFRHVLYKQNAQFFKECDGILTLGNATFEPEACAAHRAWFDPRPAYFIGPLLPRDALFDGQLAHSQEKELIASSNGVEVKTFLDTIRKSHGDHSILYISFGSNFWPLGEGIWKVIEVVLNKKIPFILSRNPERTEIPEGLQKQIDASDIALVSSWAPQHVILTHPATGWFLTHCGNNSVIEAISYGVPMIAFPLSADQPLHAAYLSSSLNVAYELYETRLGPGLLPLHRGIKPTGTLEAIERETRTVLEKAWGPDGAQKKENIRALKEKYNRAWDEDGEARIEFRKFLKQYVPES